MYVSASACFSSIPMHSIIDSSFNGLPNTQKQEKSTPDATFNPAAPRRMVPLCFGGHKYSACVRLIWGANNIYWHLYVSNKGSTSPPWWYRKCTQEFTFPAPGPGVNPLAKSIAQAICITEFVSSVYPRLSWIFHNPSNTSGIMIAGSKHCWWCFYS